MIHDNVIECNNITVQYRKADIRYATMKEAFIGFIRGQKISRQFQALDNVSLNVRRGECVALVGHNGCGKSTLLKVIAGILQPYKGTATVKGRIAPLIELGAGFDAELTGRENVYLACNLMGLTKQEIAQKIPSIQDFSELGEFFEAPVKTYSSGMYMRLGFACSTAVEPDVLLIDEILAVGDENFQKKCLDRLNLIRQSGATIIMVTHDMNSVLKMANRALVLDHGKLLLTGTAYEAVGYYHDLMDKKRSGDPISKQEIEPDKSHELVFIKSICMIGKDSPQVKTGEPAKFQIDVEILQPLLDGICIGFAIHLMDGKRVMGTNTNVSRDLAKISSIGQIMWPNTGQYKIEFCFEKFPLAAGRYQIIAAAHNGNISRPYHVIGGMEDLRVNGKNDLENRDRDIIETQSMIQEVTIKKSSLKNLGSKSTT